MERIAARVATTPPVSPPNQADNITAGTKRNNASCEPMIRTPATAAAAAAVSTIGRPYERTQVIITAIRARQDSA